MLVTVSKKGENFLNGEHIRHIAGFVQLKYG